MHIPIMFQPDLCTNHPQFEETTREESRKSTCVAECWLLVPVSPNQSLTHEELSTMQRMTEFSEQYFRSYSLLSGGSYESKILASILFPCNLSEVCKDSIDVRGVVSFRCDLVALILQKRLIDNDHCDSYLVLWDGTLQGTFSTYHSESTTNTRKDIRQSIHAALTLAEFIHSTCSLGRLHDNIFDHLVSDDELYLLGDAITVSADHEMLEGVEPGQWVKVFDLDVQISLDDDLQIIKSNLKLALDQKSSILRILPFCKDVSYLATRYNARTYQRYFDRKNSYNNLSDCLAQPAPKIFLVRVLLIDWFPKDIENFTRAVPDSEKCEFYFSLKVSDKSYGGIETARAEVLFTGIDAELLLACSPQDFMKDLELRNSIKTRLEQLSSIANGKEEYLSYITLHLTSYETLHRGEKRLRGHNTCLMELN